MGGLTPVVGSTVELYAAGAAGYGSGSASIGTAITNASGAFTVSYGCPAGNPLTYMIARTGNVGGGFNLAVRLMTALGPCNNLSPSTNVTVNELTTAATQWALAQFIDPSGNDIGAPSTNATGLQNAYAGFANLADISPGNLSVSGNPSSFLPSAPACGAVPPSGCDALERLNTLANILAGCVESGGSMSSACTALMCNATPGLIYTTSCSGFPTISDTLGAARLIVTNPANNVSALYGLAAASTPFIPALGAAPDGWEMGLNFAPAGASFSASVSLALDESGNVFVANSNAPDGGGSVSELTAASSYGTGLNFAPMAAVFNAPSSIALDKSGDVFVGNIGAVDGGIGTGSVSELTAASHYVTGLNFAPTAAAFNSPPSIALDGSGDVFAANSNLPSSGGSVSELTAGSSYTTGLNFSAAGASFDEPFSVALDKSGNVFVTNENGNSVSELTAASSYATGLNLTASGASFDAPRSIAPDKSGNLFVGNFAGSVSELTAGSSYGTGFNFAPAGAALLGVGSIAVDGSGNVFVANGLGNSVSELTAGAYGTGFNFAPTCAAFDDPESIAVDASGNIFVANFGNGVSEIMGLAKPVITPVQSCLAFWAKHSGQACVP